VLPGLVATEQVRAMPAEVMQRWLEVLPAGRLIEPEAVAALVAFLASETAGSITGEALGIDGGMHLSTVDFGSKRRVSLELPPEEPLHQIDVRRQRHHRLPAVDVEALARHPLGRLGRQEEDRLRDVLRAAHPPERDV